MRAIVIVVALLVALGVAYMADTYIAVVRIPARLFIHLV
jgi:hypothetical protein